MAQVELRTVKPIRVALLRASLASFRDQGDLWGELLPSLLSQGLAPRGPTISQYYSMEPIDMAVCAPLDPTDQVKPHDRIVVKDLEEALMAVYTHRGAMGDIPSAYEALFPWVEASEYEQAGPSREVYIKVPMGADVESGDWDNVVVEVHVPVKLKAT
ncbi:hypothetical protein SPRG_11289 [Saprolegnia parasitica CBS 223.65]|uniref:AraC effector-binding domain-containing protein n=1 Tax=Saprolegnia parasitica (strain CBS 223.65) TaxID=695850 RepID=A0A067C007_SAPPC|nr:hypothetical protein SPRG_11289 [Saprolegnia parasitica CBS 223.65]KDO23858.1 hypothetical protein SPRG_11289 [Saprolegnia parasitica CBS 223.65]|eukprot:XP_012205490.1 hypothetical protein SPRG_11289 [Saprolegnia parasitica CBS 223.65]